MVDLVLVLMRKEVVGIVEKEGLKWRERDLGRIGKMDLANMILESTSRLQAQVETVSQPLEVKLNYIPKGGTSDQSSLSRSNRSKSRNRISSQGTLLPSSSFKLQALALQAGSSLT